MKIFASSIFLLLVCVSLRGFSQTDKSDALRQKAEELSIDGQFLPSLEFYQQAYQLVKKTDPARAANLCNDISSAYYGEGQYKTALRYCRKGLGHIQKHASAPDSLFFKLYSSLGTMQSALHQRDSAYFYFERADAVLDKNPAVEQDIPLYVLHHYLHQGRAFWALHRYYQSITYFIKAKRLSERFRLPDELDYIESSLAEGYDLLGKHRDALKYRLASTKHNFLNSSRKQELYSGVAFTYQRLNLPDSALLWHKLSWKEHLLQPQNTVNYNTVHLRLLFLIGSCYRQKGRLDEAEVYLKRADDFHAKNLPQERYYKADILIEKGRLAYARRELNRAEIYYNEAFKTVSLSSSFGKIQPIDLIYPQTAFLALSLKAALLSEKYRNSNEVKYLTASFQCFRELIALKRMAFYEASEDTEDRHFISEESHDIYQSAIPVGYELYSKNHSPVVLQEIFDWFEDANASYLFDIIRDKNLYNKKIPPEILAQEQALMQKRAVLAGSVNDSTGKIEHEMENLRDRWYVLRQAAKKKYSTGQLTFQDPIKISAVKNNLDENSAFISYKWFDNNLYVFVITKEKTQLIKSPVNSKLLLTYLQNLQKEFNNNPGFGNYTGSESAIGCYKILIDPVKKWLANKTRIVVARDWQFNFLPLELLETGKTNNDYLVKHYAVSYTYSASFFWQHPFLEKTQDLSEGSFSKLNSSMIIAPFISQQTSGLNPVSSLEDLEEIGGESMWGERATKQEFFKTGLGHHVLHFATHAEAQDTNPNDSFIQFYPGTDSRLYLSEIYSLPLYSTRLIILSACSAGKGKNIRGEGNISLAHAIAQAGCPSIVTTVWEANDDVISYLSRRLYKHLQDGQTIDKAIQMARLDFFADKTFKKYAHPYYWANFTLIGNSEPVYSKPVFYKLSATLLTKASVIILLLISVLAIIKRKKQRVTT